MTDIRTKVQEHKTAIKVASASLVPAVLSAATAVTAFAGEESSGSTSIRSTMQSSFSSIGNDILGFFGDILPIALPILGAGLVIGIGIAIFKKVTKKASS